MPRYIGSILGKLLLTNGYFVRGTARTLAKAEPLLKGPYAGYEERIEIVEVPDISLSGAFDEAVKGVDGILHLASPVDFSESATYDTAVVPAVGGTEGLLESALKAGPQLTSVVITSSTAAVIDDLTALELLYNEEVFATVALDITNKQRAEGVPTNSMLMYCAGKTAAERAMWKFKDDRKPSFSISSIIPVAVFGPPLIIPASSSQLNETLIPIYNILSGSVKTLPEDNGDGSWVNVEDVAFMHLWALEHPDKVNGERYIACAGFGPYQAVADVLRQKYKGTKIAEKIVVGVPGTCYIGYNEATGEVRDVKYPPRKSIVSGKKAEKEMEFTYRSFVETIEATANAFEVLL